MLRALKTSLDSAKGKLRDLFYQHGKLCATHPLVVLSLTFTFINTCSAPAIWAYFYNPSSIEQFWEFGGSAVPVKSDSTPPAGSNIIGIEQIVIETSLNSELKTDNILDPGSLNLPTLKLAYDIQLALLKAQVDLQQERGFTLKDICLKITPDEDCLVYSPLEFWDNQIHLIEEGVSLSQKVSNWVVNSTMGFSIPAWSVFSGIQQGHDPRSFYGAVSLQLTYFMRPHSELSDSDSQLIWDRLWQEVSQDLYMLLGEKGELKLNSNSEVSSQPKLTLLEFTFPRFRFSIEVIILSLGYLSGVIYMFFSMSRFQLVKSKFWLGFAAVLILNVSILMAFGIYLFFGSELSLIPWKVVPFLIIAVGSENVLRITQSVVSTSLDLPVRERVGEGVRNCSIGITCHLCIELSILSAVYFSLNPALSEFGMFGALAVVIDYILQLTFFVAVLSIDIRRLELSDLQELKDQPASETKKPKRLHRDADESLLLANVWDSMVSQVERMKTYSVFKFAMIGISLFSAVVISRRLRQTTVFSYPQGLKLSGMESPYQSQLDEKFWELINPNMSQLYLKIRPAKRLILTWSPSPERLAELSHPSKLLRPNMEVVRKPTFLTLLLLLSTGICITLYLNLLSRGRRKEKARWQSLDPRKSIRIFKEFWADVHLLESNGQELVAALSLDGELVVWNYHINRVWRRPDRGIKQRITSLAVSTHSWLAVGTSSGAVDFESLVDSSRNLSSLLIPGVALVSQLLFLPENPNILAVLAGHQLFIYDIKRQTMLFSSESLLSINCIRGLPQAVFAGLNNGRVLAISIDMDTDMQLTSTIIPSSFALPITFLDVLDLDGRFRALLVGFKNNDCEVRMLSDINDLGCSLTLLAPEDASDILGLRLVAASDGFVATVSFPAKTQITHLSHRNVSGITPPISPGNFFLRTTSSAGVPSTGCPYTFTHGDTLIGLSRNSHQWELWGVSLSRGSLESAVKDRLEYSLVCDPLVPDGSSQDTKSNKVRPWVPFGFVSLPFVPLSENRGLGIALGNYIFCINPQLLLSSQED